MRPVSASSKGVAAPRRSGAQTRRAAGAAPRRGVAHSGALQRRSRTASGQRSVASGSGASCRRVAPHRGWRAACRHARTPAPRAAWGERQHRLQLEDADIPRRARARMPSTPANRCRLPRTSSSTASGNSRLTRGVNCWARGPAAAVLERLSLRQMHGHPQPACCRGAGRVGRAGRDGPGERCGDRCHRREPRWRCDGGDDVASTGAGRHPTRARRPAGAPRAFSTAMRTPAGSGSSPRRKTAGEGRRAAPWTKQHPERAAALGGELQTAELARLRLTRHASADRRHPSRAPARKPTAGVRRSPRRHDRADAAGDERRRERHERRHHPYAPAAVAAQVSAASAGNSSGAHRCRNGRARISISPVRGQPLPGSCSSSGRETGGAAPARGGAAAAPDGRVLEQTSEFRIGCP